MFRFISNDGLRQVLAILSIISDQPPGSGNEHIERVQKIHAGPLYLVLGVLGAPAAWFYHNRLSFSGVFIWWTVLLLGLSLATPVLPIAAKWLLIGRFRPGGIPPLGLVLLPLNLFTGYSPDPTLETVDRHCGEDPPCANPSSVASPPI